MPHGPSARLHPARQQRSRDKADGQRKRTVGKFSLFFPQTEQEGEGGKLDDCACLEIAKILLPHDLVALKDI